MTARRSAAAAIALLLAPLILFAKPPSLRVDAPGTYAPEELSIAINPTNPDVVIAGANLNHVFVSHDGGITWSTDQMTSSLGVWGDPVLLFGPDGTVYYAHLSYGGDWPSWLDRIVVQRSSDDGLTWSDGVGVGLEPPTDHDKEWLDVDRTGSPHHGRVHMTWTKFDAYGSSAPEDSSYILYSHSDDQASTWSMPLRINEDAGDCVDDDLTAEGAVPAVGPDGQVYVAWSRDGELWFDRSLDGGATFGPDVHVGSQPGGWVFDIPGLQRCNGLPITVCDVSGSSRRGRIYVLFSDQRHGVDDTDVFLVHSDDQGDTWSAPTRVNGDVGASHQFFPWLAIDPVNGDLYAVYYDRSETTGFETDVMLSWSNDGGATFRHTRLSESSFSPQDDVFMGDYIGVAAYDGVVHAVWTRMDAGALSVWTARLERLTDVASETGPIVSRNRLTTTAANPSGQESRLFYRLYDDAEVILTIHDLRGRVVRTLESGSRARGEYSTVWNGRDDGGAAVPSGVYLCNLRAGRETATVKVTIVR